MALYEVHTGMTPELPFYFYHLPISSEGAPKNVFVNWHSNIELVYSAGGNGEVLCGAHLAKIQKGELAVINTNLLHDIISHSFLDSYCLIVSNDFCRANGIDPEKLLFEELINDRETEELFLRVISAFECTREHLRIPETRYAVLGLMLNLYKKHTRSAASFGSDTANAARIKEILSYIKRHFAEKLTLEGIAREQNISKSYLVHEFKKHTGQTVVEYINILRCANAQSLIRNGASVSSAALSSGFENLSYFSRIYKKYMSVLPSKDR